jgi:hypothetical protein
MVINVVLQFAGAKVQKICELALPAAKLLAGN